MPVTINGTTGIVNNATDLNYTGTLTGGTGVVNLGSGQFVKDASGRIQIPNQPAFHVKLNTGATYTTVADIQFTQVICNVGGHYSTSTYKFTAPVAGTYAFFAKAFIEVAGRASINILVNGSPRQGLYGPQEQGDLISGNLIVTLAANDFVTAYLRQGTIFGDGSGTNYDAATFSGYLIG